MDDLGIAKNFESYTGYNYEQLLEYLSFSKGWAPFDRKDGWKVMPIDECGPSIIRNFYDSSGKPTLKKSLQKVKQIADRYNVKLIVIFNPVACEDSEQIIPIHNDLEIFKKKNPDVYIPFGFITSIDKEEFSKMKDGVGIVNAARGGVINEESLIDFIDSGKIKFAGLDTFENEPNPSIKTLMNSKISLTPHIGAATSEAQERIGIELADQIISEFK